MSSDFCLVAPRLQNSEFCHEVIFTNGIKNPWFDPSAMSDFQPTIYQSNLIISDENPTGAFPPAMTSDYVLNYVADYSKTAYCHLRSCSRKVLLQATKLVPTNISYKGKTFTKALVMTEQTFALDIPANWTRPLNTRELASLPIKIIGPGDESTCTVCMDDFSIGIQVVELICGHTFCEGCIKEWIRRTGCCPNCKSPVREADLQGTTVRINPEGSSSGGVLGLKNSKRLNQRDEQTITDRACHEFAEFFGLKRSFPLIETKHFTVLPLASDAE